MKTQENDYKTYHHCGQNEISFKMGIGICGKQQSNIQYIENTKRLAKNYYSIQ
ncbi:MAG: hypothetical protein ACR2LL_13560 [Nitrosopumilus sp.]